MPEDRQARTAEKDPASADRLGKDQAALRTCACGCGRSLEGRRVHAAYHSGTCRVKAARKRKPPPTLPGPTLGELVAAYQAHLLTKGADAQRAFARIAVKLAPWAERPVLTITAEEWENWLAEVTASFAPSYRRLTRRYLLASLGGTAHWLAPGPPRPMGTEGTAVDVTDELERALTEAPTEERDRLLGELVLSGWYVREIQRLRLGADGQIELGRPNWRRDAAPSSLSPSLELRLRAYAIRKGIRAGTPLFGLSGTWIRAILARGLRRAGLHIPPSTLARALSHRYGTAWILVDSEDGDEPFLTRHAEEATPLDQSAAVGMVS